MVIPVDRFFLDIGYKGTLQQRLRQLVADGILTGRFPRGEKLPSTRKLATHLGISRLTVTLAYAELVSGDYITARGRSGYYVSDSAPVQPRFEESPSAMTDTVDWIAAIGSRGSGPIRHQKPKDWWRFEYPFIYGQADPSLFDHHNWRLCATRALGKGDFENFTTDFYEQDDEVLVEYIARHILPRRGIQAEPGQILLTMGAQNALWIVSQLLLSSGRIAVTENPCYPGLKGILHQTGCAIIPVPVDGEGLRPESLPRQLDVAFVTPSHQCPTNATMPTERRQKLLSRANEQDFLIVEDDYEFEISFLKPPSPALKSLDTQGRVLYIGSFSKSLFPGLRLGYLVASEAFIKEARSLRATILRHPPGHIQRTTAYFLSLGHYDALVGKIGKAYRRRREVANRAISDAGLRIAGLNMFGGSSYWMRAPDGVDTVELTERLAKREVLIEPGRDFFMDADPPRNYYRLAYSSISENRILPGIQRIAAAIAESGLKQAG